MFVRLCWNILKSCSLHRHPQNFLMIDSARKSQLDFCRLTQQLIFVFCIYSAVFRYYFWLTLWNSCLIPRMSSRQRSLGLPVSADCGWTGPLTHNGPQLDRGAPTTGTPPGYHVIWHPSLKCRAWTSCATPGHEPSQVWSTVRIEIN